MNIGVGPKQHNYKVDISFDTFIDALSFAQEGDVVFISASYVLVDRLPKSFKNWIKRDCLVIGSYAFNS